MGCVSSKHVRREHEREARHSHHHHRAIFHDDAGQVLHVHVPNHVVSLTSSTYGVLKLDEDEQKQQRPPQPQLIKESISQRLQGSPPREEPEVINAWELMEGLEEGAPSTGANASSKTTPSPKPRALLRGLAKAVEARTLTPQTFMNPIGSPRKANTYGGKENKGNVNGLKRGGGRSDYTPKETSKLHKSSNGSSNKAAKSLRFSTVGALVGGKRNSFGIDHGVSSRRSLGPLFDPELLASYEKELSEGGDEQIKKMISPLPKIRKPRNFKQSESESVLCAFEKKCPPGGDNAVVVYTTTLRGIRKTFEDCNTVRSVMESYCVQMVERDVSMDSGYKEELRKLVSVGGMKVPLVFVKGRLIGGADEVVKLEEEGKLAILLDGIPSASHGSCEGCGGVRFVMCMECNGSCKVFDEEAKVVVKCGECNENGLIHCPLCC